MGRIRTYLGTNFHSIKVGKYDPQLPQKRVNHIGRLLIGLDSLFVCLGGRHGEADELDCDPLQRVGIPFFRDLASCSRTLLLFFNPQ